MQVEARLKSMMCKILCGDSPLSTKERVVDMPPFFVQGITSSGIVYEFRRELQALD
jgi:hypothetical protein